jgi:pterin-4a-carbinolamine dehydratase
MSAQSHAQPTFSSNYSAEQGTKDLEPLLKTNGGKWTLIESGKGVERTFKFKTFKKTWVRVFLLSVLGLDRWHFIHTFGPCDG